MADLHYMEMGWSGSGWMDPLSSEPPPAPAPTPASTPATPSYAPASSTDDERRPVTRKSPRGPAKKAAKRSA